MQHSDLSLRGIPQELPRFDPLLIGIDRVKDTPTFLNEGGTIGAGASPVRQGLHRDANGPDAHKVIGHTITSTEGWYGGSRERSFNSEVVAERGWNPMQHWKDMVALAKSYGQDAVYLAKALDLKEGDPVDYSKHVPGLEIYLDKPVDCQSDDFKEIVKHIPEGQGFTIITDPKRTPDVIAGKMPHAIGLRMLVLPEFPARYGDTSWTGSDADLAQKVKDEHDKLLAIRDTMQEVSGVTKGLITHYEVNTSFGGDYDADISGSAGRDAGKTGQGEWAGLPLRERLARAARQLAASQPAAPEADGSDGTGPEGHGEGQATAGAAAPDAAPRGRDGGIPEFAARSGSQNPVSIHGVHFSPEEGLDHLDGSRYGTGAAGRERQRLASEPADSILHKRNYFYESTDGSLPRKEAVVPGRNPYESKFHNIYDLEKDPEGLIPQANDANSLEHSIVDAGYDGYVNRAAGMSSRGVVLLGHDKIPVRKFGGEEPSQEAQAGSVHLYDLLDAGARRAFAGLGIHPDTDPATSLKMLADHIGGMGKTVKETVLRIMNQVKGISREVATRVAEAIHKSGITFGPLPGGDGNGPVAGMGLGGIQGWRPRSLSDLQAQKPSEAPGGIQAPGKADPEASINSRVDTMRDGKIQDIRDQFPGNDSTSKGLRRKAYNVEKAGMDSTPEDLAGHLTGPAAKPALGFLTQTTKRVNQKESGPVADTIHQLNSMSKADKLASVPLLDWNLLRSLQGSLLASANPQILAQPGEAGLAAVPVPVLAGRP